MGTSRLVLGVCTFSGGSGNGEPRNQPTDPVWEEWPNNYTGQALVAEFAAGISYMAAGVDKAQQLAECEETRR